MNKAAFFIKDYQFPKVNIDLSCLNTEDEESDLDVSINPRGIYNKKEQVYKLIFDFTASTDRLSKKAFVSITCEGYFKFENAESLKDIPKFFYRNSIAILFPYLRAYISLVTNQANIPPFILPTLNLSSLEEPLLANSIEE